MVKRLKQFVSYIFFFYGFIAAVYWVFIRPVYMNWGATPAEVILKLPKNELRTPNRVVSTRAITIKALPEDVWPWIAQTGQNYGGFNSYYWLENLFGASMVNADRIHYEWQNPQPGDTIYYGRNQGYALVSLVKINEYYSLNGWLFYLHSVNTSNTRLIVRYPSMEIKQSKLLSVYYYGLFEPLHFIMEAGMMMGIKQKAERD